MDVTSMLVCETRRSACITTTQGRHEHMLTIKPDKPATDGFATEVTQANGSCSMAASLWCGRTNGVGQGRQNVGYQRTKKATAVRPRTAAWTTVHSNRDVPSAVTHKKLCAPVPIAIDPTLHLPSQLHTSHFTHSAIARCRDHTRSISDFAPSHQSPVACSVQCAAVPSTSTSQVHDRAFWWL
ncbi:hypothetical protein CC80DRAFT_96744 [Byssothecium circinans]|uniref:Uncharacterized protein n=1 Tax=Byssothecium circinans TaxID=147558 RepID=A0A6A5UFL5_9PLEO|nr:hypothetical protein CC80DRAFT_96744 [Byssothecium circinans]